MAEVLFHLSEAYPGQRRPERPLHIAMVAPPWFEVPPSSYGGTETVVANLVDGLKQLGHQVTLIGAGKTCTRPDRFVAVYDEPPSSRLGEPLPEVLQAAAASAVISELNVDIVHDHTLAGPLAARGRRVPTVVTAHGPVTGEPGTYLRWLGESVNLVAISDCQRGLAPDLNWAGRAYNSINADAFALRSEKDDYVLWIGRFCASKGPHLAIRAAREAGVRIILAGKRNEPAEKAFFDGMVAPLLGPDAEYVGEADAKMKVDLFGGARCLVFPVCWDEPFGMVMIEAMACGTPVVALRRGSVPEVVSDGTTGFIVERPEELAEAITRSAQLSPYECRSRVERMFDVKTMALAYEQIYQNLVSLSADPERRDPGALPQALHETDDLELARA